jgi:hypothetical protein
MRPGSFSKGILMRWWLRLFVLAIALAFAPSLASAAGVPPFPAGFHVQEVATPGATIHVRVGGKGPAVVMLHGYGETGDGRKSQGDRRPGDGLPGQARSGEVSHG